MKKRDAVCAFQAITLTLLLCACSNEPIHPARDYATRLNNVLDASSPDSKALKKELAPPVFSKFPSTKQLNIERQKQAISIKEFLGLRQCKLHIALAKRNSQIGKIASPSQRLKSSLDILDSGPACLKKIHNVQLRTKLSSYLSTQQAQIPNALWHALLAQGEYKTLWSQKKHNPDYPNLIASNTLIDDLSKLKDFSTNVLSGQYSITDAEFSHIERALGRLRFGDAGQLLTELSELDSHLKRANRIVEERLKRPLCPTPKPNEKARYFENVVTKFFIQRVQAHAILLRQRHQQLMPTLNNLESTLLAHATPAFQAWQAKRNKNMQTNLNSVLSHSKKLQQLYVQCGLMPGGKN